MKRTNKILNSKDDSEKGIPKIRTQDPPQQGTYRYADLLDEERDSKEVFEYLHKLKKKLCERFGLSEYLQLIRIAIELVKLLK